MTLPTQMGAKALAQQTLTADAVWRQLHQAASDPYRSTGMFGWQFARGKLALVPVFRAVLQRGLIRPQAQVLDIGCGQGLLASLLAACDAPAALQMWPADWPPAPSSTRYNGIELMPRDVARAQAALQAVAPHAHFACADMRDVVLPRCDLVVILDVLHYVDHTAQDALLARVHAALTSGGRLLLRVGDTDNTWRFAISRWVDLCVTRIRGHQVAPTFGRSLAQWQASLVACGFAVSTQAMSQGTPFANVLLVCDKLVGDKTGDPA